MWTFFFSENNILIRRRATERMGSGLSQKIWFIFKIVSYKIYGSVIKKSPTFEILKYKIRFVQMIDRTAQIFYAYT
jgi:hypothetical protein